MGIGYSGVSLSQQKSCAEIGNYEYYVVREAWPRVFFHRYGNGKGVEICGCERKCAPVNWIVRKPKLHFTDDEG